MGRKSGKPAGPGRLGGQVRQAGTLWCVPSGLARLACLACLSCNGPVSLASGSLFGSGSGSGSGRQGCAREKGTPNGRARRPMYPAKSALAQEGGSAKLIAGNIPKLRHSTAYLVWVHAHAHSPSPSTCLPLGHSHSTWPTGSSHARSCRAPFPARCLLALLCWLGWLAAQSVRCSTTCFLPWPTIYHLPISLSRARSLSLSAQALQTVYCGRHLVLVRSVRWQ